MDVGAVDEVRVRFWGVRGSIPTPGSGTVRYGGNTSCVSVEAAGHDLLVLDAGSGIRLLGLDLIECKRLPVTAHLFLSHTHWDHIQGFPFFAPAFIPGNSICIYGAAGSDEGLIEALEGQMLHRYFPVTLDELGASFSFQRITPGSHEVGGARITVAPLHHPGSTVGYRLELNGCIVAYVTDTEPLGAADRPQIDPATLLLARDADVLIHDAQYTDEEYPKKVGWGHSPVSHVVDLAVAAGARRLFLFHHDPLHMDDQVDAMVATARARAAFLGGTLEVAAAAEGTDLRLAPNRLPQPAHSMTAAVAAG